MTRINLSIDPTELCDQMLVAEYRELPRIRGLVLARIAKGQQIPTDLPFTLGRGHVSFFFDKGRYLETAWFRINQEMRHRGFTVNLTWRPWPHHPAVDIYKDVDEVTKEVARNLLIERISQQIAKMKRPPKWTKRTSPRWADDAILSRHA